MRRLVPRVLLWGMLSGAEPTAALRRTCAPGALVATRDGANPAIGESDVRALLKA